MSGPDSAYRLLAVSSVTAGASVLPRATCRTLVAICAGPSFAPDGALVIDGASALAKSTAAAGVEYRSPSRSFDGDSLAGY